MKRKCLSETPCDAYDENAAGCFICACYHSCGYPLMHHHSTPIYTAFLAYFDHHPTIPCRLFLSATDMRTRAITRHACAATPQEAWHIALAALTTALETAHISPTIVRADWVVAEDPVTWGDFTQAVQDTRRNYFRRGIALDKEWHIAFTEMELNANAMLYKPINSSRGRVVLENCADYCRRRFACAWPQLTPESPVTVFRTEGVFVEQGKEPLPITGQGLDAGHRDIAPYTPEVFLSCARTAADYLVNQCQKTGRFHYGWFSCFDKRIPAYNTLRHISTTWSLLQAYGAFKTAPLRAAIQRSIDYIVKTFARHRSLPDGEAIYFEDVEAGEIKLGSSGCMLIMLARYAELINRKKYLPLMRCVARGILAMQEEDGSFVHVLHSKDFSLKERTRIVYYDGEAVFGLLRLYSLTKDAALLAAAQRAFARFIATNHWENRDHWLSYAVNELTRYDPRREYFQFGIRNFNGYLDFVATRDTAFPTLLELMLAAQEMLERLDGMPEMADLLAHVDRKFFTHALHTRAHMLFNGYFWPEFAMFFQNPAKIVGSFFIKHHAFRVRIDDVQHYISGFITYADFLKKQPTLPEEETHKPTIFFAGDVNLGRRMHRKCRDANPLQNLSGMREADLRIVNLECVISNTGTLGVDKGEGGPYFFRARPEQLNVLTAAQVDVVLTANNHSCDYGPDALLEQIRHLADAGIRYAGSGADVAAAARPVYAKAGELTVAIFSVDATMKYFAATETRPGTWYLPPTDCSRWEAAFRERIAHARRHAHIVLVAPHWGANGTTQPRSTERTLGRLLIDLGADAVLGCHAHHLHGVESYRNRPILYDAGNILFDAMGSADAMAGYFLLELSANGVERVIFRPVLVGYGRTEPAQNEQRRASNRHFGQLCAQLGTTSHPGDDGDMVIDFSPPVRESQPDVPEISPQTRRSIAPLENPLADWIAAAVPEDARTTPVTLGPLTLLGCRVPQRIVGRAMLYVETWWTCSAPEDAQISLIARPLNNPDAAVFGLGMEHEGCDWMWPTNRWQPGTIYRERFGLRPPEARRLPSGAVRLEISVRAGNHTYGPHQWEKVTHIQPATGRKLRLPDGTCLVKAQQAPFDVFFLLRQVLEHPSGLELSAFRRAALFATHLHKEVRLLTNRYEPEAALQLQRLGVRDRLLNMYDFYQGVDRTATAHPVDVDALTHGMRVQQVQDSRDLRVYDGKKHFMYMACDQLSGRLRYINHFNLGIKTERDNYDPLGFLSRRQMLDPVSGQAQTTMYFRPDGTVAAREDAAGILTLANGTTFSTKSEAIAHWLQQLTAAKGLHVLIGDRSPEYSQFFTHNRQTNIRVIHMLHNLHVLGNLDPMTAETKRWYNFLFNPALRSNAIVAATEQQRDDVMRRYGLTNVVAIPHAVAPMSRLELSRDRYKIVFAGRLVQEKGPAAALMAFYKMHQSVPQAHLHFCGEGNMRATLESRARALGLADAVVFEGFCDNMPAMFASAGLFVSTSRNEGFSLVIGESLAAGCPVVSFDCNYGPSCMINNGVNGFLLPPGDVDGLAARMTQLLQDVALWQTLAGNCRDSVQQLSPSAVAELWARLLLAVAGDISL